MQYNFYDEYDLLELFNSNPYRGSVESGEYSYVREYSTGLNIIFSMSESCRICNISVSIYGSHLLKLDLENVSQLQKKGSALHIHQAGSKKYHRILCDPIPIITIESVDDGAMS